MALHQKIRKASRIVTFCTKVTKPISHLMSKRFCVQVKTNGVKGLFNQPNIEIFLKSNLISTKKETLHFVEIIIIAEYTCWRQKYLQFQTRKTKLLDEYVDTFATFLHKPKLGDI